MSSRRTSAGPQGPNVSIALPPVHSVLAICRSRALTSLKAIAPATWPSASASAMLRPRVPMTTASSAS